MNLKVFLLRFCFWLGAILDARAAFHLTLIRYRELPASIAAHQGSQALGTGALWSAGDACALMWGWTALLLWADRKPIERRGVLLLTVVPVVLLLQVQRLQLSLSGFQPFSQVSSWFYFLIALAALFTFSYCYASAPQDTRGRLTPPAARQPVSAGSR